MSKMDEMMNASLKTFVPEKAKDWDRTILYNITGPGGGQWHIVVKDQKYELKSGGHGKPDLEFEMDSDTFIAMSKGEISAVGAFMQGKMKAKGSTSDLIKMGEVFPVPIS
jgi:putative sterol carrier protein